MPSDDPNALVATVEPAPAPRRGRSSAFWRVGLSVAVILVLMLWILGAFRAGVIPARNETAAAESAAGLPTHTVTLEPLPAATEAVGAVQAEQVASVTSRVVAVVMEVRVSAGQRVASGAILAVLDNRDLQRRVEQAQDARRGAEASLAQARADYARDKPLFEQKVITPYDFEHTRTALDIADANLHRLQQAEREAEVGLSYAVIRSPFTGTVVDTLANVGDLAAPGKPLLTMYEQGRLWFAANVPENLLGRLHIGDALTFRIDALDRDRQGRVVEIVPSSDPASRTIVVRLHMTDTTDVLPGMFGRLRIPMDPEPVLALPASAVVRAGQLTMVDVARGGSLERRTVQLGRAVGAGFEVLSGLAAGETVVLRGGAEAPQGEGGPMSAPHDSLTIRIVRKFLDSNLSVVFILVSIAAGALALIITPREEEPQITVAAANVMVSFPGRSAEDVEQLVSTPLEKMLYQIPGVEYVYSRSMPGQSIVTVRFYVGQPLKPSYVKLIRKLNENVDRMTPGASGWAVKPIDVDDVPIVTFTLTSGTRSDYELRRMADELVVRLQGVDNAGLAYVVGGRPRELLIRPSTTRMASYGVASLDLGRAIQSSNSSLLAGAFDRNDRDVRVQAGQFIADARDLGSVVVGVWSGRPVSLRDVADITDGPGEFTDYVRFHRGLAWDHPKEAGAVGSLIGGPGAVAPPPGAEQPAVTVALAKKHGTNNVWVADDLLAKMTELKKAILPADVQVVVSRNYGVTANDKVGELQEGLVVAIVVVMALLAIGLGVRQALVVAIVVPCVFGLTLIVNYFLGFSINRISLFALTVSIGLLVDDPIVDVENIHRHFRLAGRATADIVLDAVNEVRPPLIAATFAVILSFLPLLFVTDMMGQYLRPMAANVPVTMLMSLAVSFTITPWLAYHLLKGHAAAGEAQEAPKAGPSAPRRFFNGTLRPLIDRPRLSRLFLLLVFVLFVGSVLLVLTRRVQVKQLPYDNKDEILLVLDLPTGTTLERTDAAAREFERYLKSVPEVTDFEAYVGTTSPVDFNGLMRQYFLRRAPNRADIRVNLIHKTERAASSHALGLRLRADLTAIAARNGVKLKIVELPAGPPAMATLVAAVYGSPTQSYEDLIGAASIVKARLRREPGVVDVDDTVEEDQTKFVFDVDKQKAALNGISTDDVARTMALALGSQAAGIAQVPHERAPVRIALWFPRVERSSLVDLSRIYAKGAMGSLVALSELGAWHTTVEDKTIYHRQLQRVVYVLGEMAGRPPVETILDLRADQVQNGTRSFVDEKAMPIPLAARTMFRKGAGVPWEVARGITIGWWDEGEMYITIHLFRDLGFAMLAALIAIYIILMNQTGSYTLPLTIMLAIPLMVIGVLPGFWLLNHVGMHDVGAFRDPVFFGGPAFMGMIALAGIVTRNSIIIVDFIQLGLMRGLALEEAILDSVSIRLRPILLTSGAAVLGVLPITVDTVFGGMAWSLIFGLIVSTAFSLFVIPVTYYLVYAKAPDHGLPDSVRRKLAVSMGPRPTAHLGNDL